MGRTNHLVGHALKLRDWVEKVGLRSGKNAPVFRFLDTRMRVTGGGCCSAQYVYAG